MKECCDRCQVFRDLAIRYMQQTYSLKNQDGRPPKDEFFEASIDREADLMLREKRDHAKN